MIITKTCLILGKIKDTLKLKNAVLKKWQVICKNKKITKFINKKSFSKK